MQRDRLVERRAVARLALQRDRCLLRHERQRHELGEATRFALQIADAVQVARHVDGALDVAEHDRRRRADADGVRGAHHLEPLLGVDLVGAEDGAHLVVEDLGGGARHAAEPGLFQLTQVVGERPLHRRGALPDLERRERVHVDLGLRGLHGAQDVEVPLAGEARVDAALQTDLSAAALPRLDRAPRDLVDVEQVGRTAQILGEAPLRERAEAALEVADVGVVDVPADDVRDVVAGALPAALVGELDEARELGATRGQECLGVLELQDLLCFGALDGTGEVA